MADRISAARPLRSGPLTSPSRRQRWSKPTGKTCAATSTMRCAKGGFSAAGPMSRRWTPSEDVAVCLADALNSRSTAATTCGCWLSGLPAARRRCTSAPPGCGRPVLRGTVASAVLRQDHDRPSVDARTTRRCGGAGASTQASNARPVVGRHEHDGDGTALLVNWGGRVGRRSLPPTGVARIRGRSLMTPVAIGSIISSHEEPCKSARALPRSADFPVGVDSPGDARAAPGAD